MDGATLATVVGALMGGGLLGVLVEWRRDRKREPIDRATAEQAIKKSASDVYGADMATVRGFVDTLREEVNALQARVERAEKRAASAEERAVEAERRAVEAERRADRDARYIEVLIEHWPTPPPPPRPEPGTRRAPR